MGKCDQYFSVCPHTDFTWASHFCILSFFSVRENNAIRDRCTRRKSAFTLHLQSIVIHTCLCETLRAIASLLCTHRLSCDFSNSKVVPYAAVTSYKLVSIPGWCDVVNLFHLDKPTKALKWGYSKPFSCCFVSSNTYIYFSYFDHWIWTFWK